MNDQATMDRPSTSQTLSSVSLLYAVIAPALVLASAIIGWLA